MTLFSYYNDFIMSINYNTFLTMIACMQFCLLNVYIIQVLSVQHLSTFGE